MSDATIYSDRDRPRLTFEGQDYLSKAFGRLLSALAINTLAISVDSSQHEKDSQNFQIAGSAQILDQPVKVVSIYFEYFQGDKFEFQFKAILPSLTFKTLQDRNILPQSPFIGPFDATYKDVQLIFDSEDERLYVACIQSTVSTGQLPIVLGKLGFEYLQSYVDETALLDIYAEINVGSTPIEVKIEIPLGGELSAKYWKLTSRSTIPLGSWLKDLTCFLGETVGVKGEVFPESLHAARTVFLDDVQIILDPEKGIRFLSFRIKSVYEIEIGSSLKISKVGMRVTVIPAKPTQISLTLFGHFQVKENANLDIQVMLPPNPRKDSWSFVTSGSVNLQSLNELADFKVGTRVKDLDLPPGFLQLESLELKKFEVIGNPIQGKVQQIDFALAVIAECELIHGFRIKDPRFELTAVNPFNQSEVDEKKSLTGEISAVIAIGNEITLGLKAAKRQDGWGFSGETEQEIHLSRLVDLLKREYSTSLPEIIHSAKESDGSHQKEITLKKLSLEFSTTTQGEKKSSTVTFRATIDFPISDDSNSLNASLTVNAEVTKEPVSHKLGGLLTIGSTAFVLEYSDDADASFFVGAYSKDEGLKLPELVKSVFPKADIPKGLEIDLKNAAFAFAKTGQESRKFLFAIDLAVQFDTTKLPLVGQYFSGPGAAKIGLEKVKIVFASGPFVEKEVQDINQLLEKSGKSVAKLPQIAGTTEKASASENDKPAVATTPVLKKGVNIAAVLNLGGSPKPLSFPTSPPTQQTSASAPPIQDATTGDSAIWFNIQKAIGPVHFERVGVEFRDKKLWVLLTASLTAAGLTISLDGLSLGSPIDHFNFNDVQGNLRGLGIDYRNDAVEIGGSFSKTPGTDSKADEYSGAVTLKARALTISAVGKYTTLDGHPSMFIFGRLDYPIGGPPFFYVTGLTAGFGYQRKLVMPTIENVGEFSLIKASKSNASFEDVLRRKDILPAAGEHFLAAGVIFTSFKVVESTVLLFASFGKRFELNLLGLSRLRMPAALNDKTAVDPVAEVELAVKGTFIPDDGFLELRAQLTPTSYLFSKNCHLTGGFAFLCWFKPKEGVKSTGEEGDFVLTLGGYHPDFHKPANYPTVPRLGFNWQVTPGTLSLSGEFYFALTPAAVMAGGYLQGEWRSGKVRAWFKAGVDFLIAWKPYHYDAHAYIDIGVEVTFELFGTQRLSLDVGADLHIWGPEFSGEATVHLWIISFTIHFGSQEPSKQLTIGWEEFQNSFLLKEPPKDPTKTKPEVCSVVVIDGLVQKGEGKDLGVINGKYFCLRTDSRIPVTHAQDIGPELKLDSAFGVAPVGIRSVRSSTHSITLTRNGKPVGDGEFEFTPVYKNFPAALWGQSAPQVNGPQFINAVSGFEIRPGPLQESDARAEINRTELVNHDPKPQDCRWGAALRTFTAVPKSEQQFKDELKTVNNTMRKVLLTSLGVHFSDLDDALTYEFLKPPQSEAA
jgi:hypothetical protein